MALENTRAKGRYYEDMAAEYLESIGHRILERNFSCHQGEIDLISSVPAREEEKRISPSTRNILVFTEVKYRFDHSRGSAVEAVHARKQSKIRRVAQFYMLYYHIPEDQPCRFDVIAIDHDKIQYYPNAFGGM